MNLSRVSRLVAVGAAAAALTAMAGGAAFAGPQHSLSFAGGVFNYSGGTLSATATTVGLSYDGNPILTGTPYTLDFSGMLTGGGNHNGTLSGITFDVKNSGGAVVFAGTASPSSFFVSGNSASILGNFMTTTATSPVAGMVPGGSYGISFSGWNGVTTSGSGASGTFTTSVPEAGTSVGMAGLLIGGGLLGLRRRRK